MDLTGFGEVAGVLAVATVVAAVGLKLRQPLIISFLFAGILVGPSVTGLVGDSEQIELLASIGISLLLFIVGLRLDVGMIKTVGPVALATGLGQVFFTSAVGFAIALLFGMALLPALYVSVALTFSSTIIIVKLLSDKKEIDSLHGRIAVGFLIVQDIMAILALIGLTAFGGGIGGGGEVEGAAQPGFLMQALWILAKGAMMLGAIVVLMRWVLPRAMKYIAQSPEMLALFAIAWAVVLSASSEMLGFSKEVGAFLAGISLASTHQRDAIGARLVVLRDFLLLFFFIHLGSTLDLSLLGAEMTKAAVFSLFVLIGNPLIVLAIMGVMGYRKRTGFMSGLAVAQISEFSLILGALGLSLGHIDKSAMSLITLVGLVTICASTYMILYSGPLYARLSGVLSVFERKNPYREAAGGDQPTDAGPGQWVVMMGLGNYGSAIAAGLVQRGWPMVVVDFDPQALERARALGVAAVYGDVGDPEMLAQLPLDKTRWVVCTVRDREVNTTLFKLLQEAGYQGRVVLTAGDPEQAEAYRRLGAELVLQPFIDAAEQAVEAVTGAVQSLAVLRDWPAVVEEVALQPGSVFTGKALRELDMWREMGVLVLVVSRAGRSHFHPGPDFRLYPGDRLVLLCPREKAEQAMAHLRQREFGGPQDEADQFAAEELGVKADAGWVGSTLAELELRSRFGVTVIGIRRGEEKIASPGASDRIEAGDVLIVVGTPEGIAKVKSAGLSQADKAEEN